jgi:hypothetical protein
MHIIFLNLTPSIEINNPEEGLNVKPASFSVTYTTRFVSPINTNASSNPTSSSITGSKYIPITRGIVKIK